jgi:hypothetical protein
MNKTHLIKPTMSFTREEYKLWVKSASQEKREAYRNALPDLDFERLVEDDLKEEEAETSGIGRAASRQLNFESKRAAHKAAASGRSDAGRGCVMGNQRCRGVPSGGEVEPITETK